MKLMSKINAIWDKWRDKRKLREYYLNHSANPPGEKPMLFLLLFLISASYVFWHAATIEEGLWHTGLVLFLMTAAVLYLNKKEYQVIQRNCEATVALKEFRKRIDRASQEEVLSALSDSIEDTFPVEQLKRLNEHIEGIYKGEKIAVIYRYIPEDELVATREMMNILRKYRQLGFKRIRAFTNSDFNRKIRGLGERYELDLKLFNGEQLKKMLQKSSLCPTKKEIESIIRSEIEVRERKLALLKRQAFQGRKIITYLTYSLLLFAAARYNFGYTFMNVFFAFVLLGLAFFSWLGQPAGKEEETFL